MKKTTVLGVLAAVSLGGVGCAVEGDEQAAEQTADATAATWPARMPEDRGCVAGTAIPSGPFAGKHLRLRFPFPGAVWFQFYDPATGLLIDEPRGWSLRAAGRDGSTLESSQLSSRCRARCRTRDRTSLRRSAESTLRRSRC